MPMRRASASTSTEASRSIRTWLRDSTGTARRYGARASLVHCHRGVVAIEAVDRTAVGIEHQLLRDRIRARREQHTQHHIIAGSRVIVRQQLFDEACQTADDLVDEAQARC